MPRPAPCATTEFLKPWSTSAVLTVGAVAATLSSRAVPAAFSCADAARTTTAITSPRTSTARPRLRPGTFFPASLPVVSAGTDAAAWTLCVSSTTRDGPASRPFFSRACQRSRSWMAWSVPLSRHFAK